MLFEQRIAGVSRVTLPPELDDVESPSREADLALLELVEARHATLANGLARELQDLR